MNSKVKFLLILSGMLAAAVCWSVSFKILFVAIFCAVLICVTLFDFQKATYFIGAYVILDYLTREYLASTIFASYWDDLLFVFCICLWIFKWFFYRKTKAYQWTPLEFPIIIFFAVCIFALLFETPIFKIGVDGLRVTCQYIFWYFIAVQFFKSEKAIKRVLYLLITIGFSISLHGIYQYVVATPIPSKWVDSVETVRTRVFSIVVSPNILGSLMVLLIPICLSLAIYEKCMYKKIFTAVSTVTMSICLIFTMSRGAWICLVFALLVYMLIKDKRLLIPLTIVIVISLLFIPQISSRIDYLFSSDYVESSQSGGRLLRWGIGLKMLLEEPLFGVGLGHFGGAVAMNNQIEKTFYMDNYMLKTAVEIGFVGLFFFLSLIYSSIAWGFRTLRSLKLGDSQSYSLVHGILAGLCGVVLHNFLENIFEVPMMVTYYWLLTAMVISLGYIHTKKTVATPTITDAGVQQSS